MMWLAWMRGEWTEIDEGAVDRCQRLGIEVRQCPRPDLPAESFETKYPQYLNPEFVPDVIARECESGYAQIERYLAAF